jgi:lipoprotein NlpI
LWYSCELANSYRQAYPRLRIWIVRSRLGERDAAKTELAEYLNARQPGDDWYSRIGRFVIGGLSEDDFFRAAEFPDAKTDKDQKCEAYFYAGIRRLLDGEKGKARECFEKCLQTGARANLEYSSARSELQALDRGE